MDKIYCISGKGTAWENKQTLAANHVEEILCIRVIAGLYYCPDLHVVFKRNGEPEAFDHEYYRQQYDWDYATFPDYDKQWERLKEYPMWRTLICRIDAPKQQPITEEDL